MTRLLLILYLFLIVSVPTQAQTDSTVFLESNTPVILRLAGNGQPVEAFFAGEAGQIITVVAQAADSTTLDPVLEWVNPDGSRAAYNDDWAGDQTTPTPPEGFDSLAASDSALIRLILTQTGTYTARVNTFNGEGVGEVSLTVSSESSRALIIEEPHSIGLHSAEVAALLLDLVAGQTVTLTAHDPTGRLDSLLEVVGADGELVIANDDHASEDVALNRFDSQVTFTAEAAGIYTVQVRDFLGRAGLLIVTADVTP